MSSTPAGDDPGEPREAQHAVALVGLGGEQEPAPHGRALALGLVIATAIVSPSAEIAHGFEGVELRTTDGLTLQGVQIKLGDPIMMRSMGGVTQIVPASRVASRRRLERSLMMSAAQLGLTPQDVADLAAFLQAQ